jgi:DNA-damage-inducible protein D
MNLSQLRLLKNVPDKRSLLDFMGKQEMAANLFRITETEAKIRNENIRGQRNLETAAEGVGRRVRRTMVETSGSKPENLPPAEDIKEVHKKLKSAHRGMRRLDGPRK